MSFVMMRFNRSFHKLSKDVPKLATGRFFSSEESPVNNSLGNSFYRTDEHNPLAHGEKHIGKIYSIPNEEFKVLTLEAELPKDNQLLPNEMFARMNTLQENSLLVRKHYVELLQYLKQIHWPEQDLARFVLWGKRGVGRSITLAQIFHFAYNSNHIVIHFENLKKWFTEYKGPQKSEYKEGRWNLPDSATAALKKFQYLNGNKLDGLITHKAYKWSELESTQEGVPLTEVLETGLNRPRFAADCLNVLLKEIKLNIQDGWNKHPVMILVDGINVIFHEKTLVQKTKEKKPGNIIHQRIIAEECCAPDELSFVVALKHMLKSDYKNACLVTSVDRSMGFYLDEKPMKYNQNRKQHVRRANKMVPYTESGYPFDVLGEEGWVQMNPFVPIEIPSYSKEELDTMIDYYVDKKYIREIATTDMGREEIRFLTNRNPREFHDYSNFF